MFALKLFEQEAERTLVTERVVYIEIQIPFLTRQLETMTAYQKRATKIKLLISIMLAQLGRTIPV